MRCFCTVALALVFAGCGSRQPDSTEKSHLDALTALDAVPVFANGHVVELKLENARVDDRALEQVRHFPELTRLSLYGASVTDAGLLHLKDNRQLEALGLGATKVTDRGLDHLARMPHLRWLWLTQAKQVTPAGVARLKQALPGLTVYQ